MLTIGANQKSNRLGIHFLIFVALIAIELRTVNAADSSQKFENPNLTNRLVMGVYQFWSTPDDSTMSPWSGVLYSLVVAQLKEVKTIRVLPAASILYATRLTSTNRSVGEDASAQKEGDLLNARGMIWGTLEKSDRAWEFTSHILDTETGPPSKESKITSTNIYEIADRLTDNVLQSFGVSPTETQRGKMRRRWTQSTEALKQYGKGDFTAAIGQDNQFAEAYSRLAAVLHNEHKWDEVEANALKALKLKPDDANAHAVLAASYFYRGRPAEAEKELNIAVVLDPDDSTTFVMLAALYYSQKRWPEAIDACKTALQLNPHEIYSTVVHAQLGFLYAQRGNRTNAAAELHTASESVSTNDLDSEQFLAHGYQALGQLSTAAYHFEKSLALAKQRGMSSDQTKHFEDMLAFDESRMTPTYITNNPPQRYTQQSLLSALAAIPELGTNTTAFQPLLGSPEIANWARRLTADFTNDLQKARTLCEALSVRASPKPFPKIRTSTEAFATWTPGESFLTCQELAYLFVAAARAANLDAFFVFVDQEADDTQDSHACAIVFTKDQALLVDPAYAWFGVPHKKFTVLNDLETSVLHASVLSLDYAPVLKKIVPNLAFAHSQAFDLSVAKGRWNEARVEASALNRLDPESPLAYYAKAELALFEGKPDDAVQLLREAEARAPARDRIHGRLGQIYMMEGRLDEAREEFEKVQNCPRTEEADRMLLEELSRLANPDAFFYRNRAWVQQCKGDLQGALTNCAKAIELNSKDLDAYYLRGCVWNSLSKPNAALADWNRASEIDSNFSYPYVARAILKDAKGDLKGAIYDYQKAISLNSDFAETYGPRLKEISVIQQTQKKTALAVGIIIAFIASVLFATKVLFFPAPRREAI